MIVPGGGGLKAAGAGLHVATGLRAASSGLKGIYRGGSVRGKSIVEIRSELVSNGFSPQRLSKNKKGYLFTNNAGEQVRIMRRNDGWDIRARNSHGNWLDEYGNAVGQAESHGIEVYSG